jgi:hypothetical protein
MIDFVIKSPEGRIVVVASRQKFKYIQKGYVCIAKFDTSNDEAKELLKKGYTKEEVFAMATKDKLNLEKRSKNGKEDFYAI